VKLRQVLAHLQYVINFPEVIRAGAANPPDRECPAIRVPDYGRK
jgi:hypothetical protein